MGKGRKETRVRYVKNFRRVIYVKPNERCDWPRHFRYRTGIWKVIRYLCQAAARNPNRFTFAYVETIAKRAEVSKTTAERALHALEQLGIIVRVQNMLVENDRGEFYYHGFIVASHGDPWCRLKGSRCCVSSFGGGLREFFPKSVKKVLRVSFDVQRIYPQSK